MCSSGRDGDGVHAVDNRGDDAHGGPDGGDGSEEDGGSLQHVAGRGRGPGDDGGSIIKGDGVAGNDVHRGCRSNDVGAGSTDDAAKDGTVIARGRHEREGGRIRVDDVDEAGSIIPLPLVVGRERAEVHRGGPIEG